MNLLFYRPVSVTSVPAASFTKTKLRVCWRYFIQIAFNSLRSLSQAWQRDGDLWVEVGVGILSLCSGSSCNLREALLPLLAKWEGIQELFSMVNNFHGQTPPWATCRWWYTVLYRILTHVRRTLHSCGPARSPSSTMTSDETGETG